VRQRLGTGVLVLLLSSCLIWLAQPGEEPTLVWGAAELHCNIALPFIMRFIVFINDDNEGLNMIKYT
jgi:hypothetical protein